jgi:ureidoglycolate hydrolase
MKIKAKKLSAEGFAPYGSYFNIYSVDSQREGDFNYYPDVTAGMFGSGNLVGFSVCGINKREMQTDIVEMHNDTEEIEFCMSCDSVVLAGKESDSKPCMEGFEAFLVPKDTLIRFKRKVWHFVPFPLEDIRAMVLTALPPFTYTNDSVVAKLDERIEIEL